MKEPYLTHIDFLPPLPEGEGRVRGHDNVMIVFSDPSPYPSLREGKC